MAPGDIASTMRKLCEPHQLEEQYGGTAPNVTRRQCTSLGVSAAAEMTLPTESPVDWSPRILADYDGSKRMSIKYDLYKAFDSKGYLLTNQSFSWGSWVCLMYSSLR